MDLLVQLIAAFCFSDANLSKDSKMLCAERIVNCAIVGSGQIKKDYQSCFRQEIASED